MMIMCVSTWKSLKCYKIAIGTSWKSVFLMGFWECSLWTNAGKNGLIYNLGKVEMKKTCWSTPVSFDMSWVPWLQHFEICFPWLREHAALGKTCCKTQPSQRSWRVAQGVMQCRWHWRDKCSLVAAGLECSGIGPEEHIVWLAMKLSCAEVPCSAGGQNQHSKNNE